MRLAAIPLAVALAVLGAAPAAAQAPDSSPATRHLAIRAARLIDGRGGPPLRNAVILIDSTRITAVGADLAIPTGTRVIDLGDATVLPGLIDCHTHITSGDPGDYYEGLFRRSPIDYAVAAPTYARRTLEAGFTTVRDVGAAEFIDVALRRAIDSGLVVGPRMQVATLTVGATGGHGDVVGFSPYLKGGEDWRARSRLGGATAKVGRAGSAKVPGNFWRHTGCLATERRQIVRPR
jgi:imidazolonepropionase-like amidohydrolase